jgi:hypothetical protein
MPSLFDPGDPSVIEGEGLPLNDPAPQAKKPDWAKLAPMLALALAAAPKMGRAGVAGLLRGVNQSNHLQDQQSRQDARDAETRDFRNRQLQSQDDARNATEANQQAMRRQAFLQQFGTGLEQIDTPDAADAYLKLQAAQAGTLGIDETQLRGMVPTAATLNQRQAKKALADLQKQRPDDWMHWSVKVGDQTVKATDLIGVERDPNAPPPAAADLSKSGLDVQLADAMRRAAAGDPSGAADVARLKKAISDSDALRRDPQRQPIVVTVGGSGLTREQLQIANGLRDDYRAQAKDYFTVRDAYERVQASASNPTPAGDVALLYAYMKILDPGSVVRETEFATAAKTGSLPQQIQAAALRVVNGQRLTPEQRADFVSRAKNLYDKTQNRQNTRVAQFKRMAKSSGVPDDLVVVDDTPAEEAIPAAPPADAPSVGGIGTYQDYLRRQRGGR